MANVQLGNAVGVTDKRKIPGEAVQKLATPANYADVNAMRTRLTAINAGYFTAARLNNMTHNDMVYALRLNDDAAGM